MPLKQVQDDRTLYLKPFALCLNYSSTCPIFAAFAAR